MQKLLAKKQLLLSFILGVVTLFFTSLSFSYNPGLTYDPTRDDSNTVGINESEQGCVYRESDAATGAWVVDDCDYVGAHYACYNGGEWRIAQALGTVVNPGEPQDGDAGAKVKSVDAWDPIKADKLCKSNFGPSYFFSVPVNNDENAQLGKVIGAITASKKRTWLYFYSNTENYALTENYWLGNRTEYANLLGSSLGNSAGELGVADCTLINRDTGFWQDASCSEKHSFACYDSGSWFITKEQGEWRSGFAVCDEQQGLQALYAVPRDNAENDAIKTAPLPSGGSGVASDYNKVWLNRSDLAFEEFFISNQTRQAWWGAGQPKSRGNADCALIDSTGKWIAESCNGYVAYHACYLGDNSSGIAQWQLTDVKAESALGFGYCKQLADNAEYRPPNSAVSNDALAVLVDSLPDNKFVWINYSDQANEGFWKAESPFLDFVSLAGVVDGDTQDCGYFSLESDNKRNWLAGQCYAGGAPLQQGFACTNGYEWKIATEALTGGASLISDLWKDGFTACEAAFGKDYQFASPYDADQNSRLSLALKLSGLTQAWLNINDARSEGNWVANGPVVNLSPVITSLTPEREFPEKTDINLSVTAIDPEIGNSSGVTYLWSIIDQRVGQDGTGTDTVVAPTLTNANTSDVTLSAVDLINDDYYIDLQLQITDADVDSPATTTIVITLKITSPLLAAYNFNQYTNPALDVSGNGHNLSLNTSQVEIVAREGDSSDYFAQMDGADSFSIDGSATGLQIDQARDQYTLIYRFKLDSLPVSNWAGFVQKGEAGTRQPALFFNKSTYKIQFNNSTDDSIEAELSLEEVRLDQWMTVAYVKNGSDTQLYIDKAELNVAYPDPNPLNVIPDTEKTLLGASLGYASGDWVFGNVPGASEGIIGGFDDIRIYDRALTASELVSIFPDQEKGVFEFTNAQETGDENEVEAAVNELLIPVKRIKGDDGIVSVGFELISDSAVLDTDFRLKDDPEAQGSSDRGKGTLTWAVHDVADKNITVELIGDDLREGTETFQVQLVKLPAEPELAANAIIDVNIVDKTPNPYGAIGIAPETATDNIAVDEGNSGIVTVERVGTDSLGAFDVIYEIETLTAISPDDFTITQAGFPIAGTPNGSVLGQGRLSFPNNASGTPVTRQTQTISFDSVLDGIFELDEIFSVTLIKVTDAGSETLADPSTSAILGTKRSHGQIINDITPGRISFKQTGYTVDEVDQGSTSNVVLVELERIEGDDGEICVTLDFAGSTATAVDDYTIDYLNPSASGQADIFWADKDKSNKKIQISILNNDELYDPNETIELSWVYEASCSSVMPDAAEATDNDSASVAITDVTTPVKVKFKVNSYSIPETDGTVDLVVQATQTDFTSLVNNSNESFQVYLNFANGTAVEGTHYSSFSRVVSFAPGQTEQTVAVPIIDNCAPDPSFSVELGLLNDHASISNQLPTTHIDVSNASGNLDITNATAPISVSGIVYDYDGINNMVKASWNSLTSLFVTSDISATSRNPKHTQMRLKADVTHNCLNNLTANWSYVGAIPSLPSGADVPANFSSAPSVAASSNPLVTEKITLPFVNRSTDLNFSVSITDTETGVTYTSADYPDLDHSVQVDQYWRAVENANEGGDNCLAIEGAMGSDIRVRSCTLGADDKNKLAYNPTTKQLVFRTIDADKPTCLQYDGTNQYLLGTHCSASNLDKQKWTFSGERVKNLTVPSEVICEYVGSKVIANDPEKFAVCVGASPDWSWYEL